MKKTFIALLAAGTLIGAQAAVAAQDPNGPNPIPKYPKAGEEKSLIKKLPQFNSCNNRLWAQLHPIECIDWSKVKNLGPL